MVCGQCWWRRLFGQPLSVVGWYRPTYLLSCYSFRAPSCTRWAACVVVARLDAVCCAVLRDVPLLLSFSSLQGQDAEPVYQPLAGAQCVCGCIVDVRCNGSCIQSVWWRGVWQAPYTWHVCGAEILWHVGATLLIQSNFLQSLLCKNRQLWRCCVSPADDGAAAGWCSSSHMQLVQHTKQQQWQQRRRIP
jgi:hypothetical protein